jgi:CDP-diacylglycerol--serine O-phosphatidyltransferase
VRKLARELRRRRLKKVPRRLRQGVFLLPSALTTGNMLLGFFAIVRGLVGDFHMAALLIFCAGVVDSLDGRIARLTGTASEFGAEYDSLADVITFGMAPALLAYLWGLSQFGRAGWLVPVFYLVCAATRLARFNVQIGSADSRSFVGLPTPAAAGAVCSILFFLSHLDMAALELRQAFGVVVLVSLLAVGFLMVSTFRYASFKALDLRRPWSYRAMLPMAAVILIAAWRPTAFFLSAATLYTLSGPVAWLWGRLRRREPEPATETPDEGETP